MAESRELTTEEVRAVNVLQRTMTHLGFDFETHATKKVRYLGGGFGEGLVRPGELGEILYTWPGDLAQVQVRWASGNAYGHAWKEIEALP